MISHIRILRGPTFGWISAAATVSVIVGQVISCWVSLCGTSPNSLAALAIGFAVGLILIHWIRSQFPDALGAVQAKLQTGVILGMLSAGLCWSMPLLMNTTLLAGCESIRPGWPLSSLLILLFPAVIAAIVVATAGMFFWSTNPFPATPWVQSVIVGTPGVVLLLVFSAAISSSISLAAASTVVICGTVLWSVIWRLFPVTTMITSGNAADNTSILSTVSSFTNLLHTIAFVSIGLLVFIDGEILGRLVPLSLPVLIQAACLTALGLMILSRPLTMKLLTIPAMQFFAMLTLALLPMLLGPLMNLNLYINAAGYSSAIVLFLRSLQIAVFATAAMVPAVCVSVQRRSEISSRNAVLSFVSGILLGMSLLGSAVSPTLLLGATILVYATSILVRTAFDYQAATGEAAAGQVGLVTSTRFSIIRRYALPTFGLCCAGLVEFGDTNSSRASSLLFSERTAAAVQRGVAQDLILQSHANRLITAVSGQSGELTVWRRTGNVFEFQRNGASIGRVSTNTSVSPQPIEDILPAIFPLVSHSQPSRVLLLGDDTGVCLRTVSHFPVQQIVAVRSDVELTKLAQQFSWRSEEELLSHDERIRILHEPATIAVRQRKLSLFDVVISTGDNVALPSAVCEYTTEFYQAVRSRMTADGVFCQRFRQSQIGPQPLKESMASLMSVFKNVGVIQSTPGEILLLASDTGEGLIDPELMTRLQKEHVRREIASAGMDWAQIAILPMLDANDPLGIFVHETRPPVNSVGNNSIAMRLPFDAVRSADKQAELHAAFGPHQMQVLAAIPGSEDHHEVKRRLSALAQEMEILAGMPDQPWTYRKSLQMEMKQSPRPPQDLVESGKISKVAHPLDMLRRQYFISLGKALTAASRNELNIHLIEKLDTFTQNFEPLITHFAHYEIVRLHELASHPSPADEFHHRLHIVFFTSSTDASVRPVISALQQLVDEPTLIADDAERYDILNSLVQKLIERWEARTAWEPRSALRVQNDVEMSVGVANRALEQMEAASDAAHVEKIDFYRRRRYISAALINPLRDYRDQVLAHRNKAESPVEQNTEDPHDVPLLINSGMGLNTN